MKTLSITRALAEIKLYDKKIEQTINALKPVTIQKPDGSLNTFPSEPSAFISQYNSQMDQLQDLRANKAKLKAAINKTNAETKVTIGDHTYTIVEAIQRKNDISTDRYLLQKLQRLYNNTVEQEETYNSQIDQDIQKSIEQRSSSSATVAKDFAKDITETMSKLNKVSTCNKEAVSRQIDELEAFITEFEANIDMTLSEINARTDITIN